MTWETVGAARTAVINCKASPVTIRVFEGRTFLFEFAATAPELCVADIEQARTYVPPAVPA